MAKKAVLIGCNYPGTKAELKGCINDVHRMYKCLVERFRFSPENINVLIDTDDSYTQPTGRNIRTALGRLVRSAEPGDFLFVHYSGHGTRLPAETGEEDDTGYDECIVPTDINLITGNDDIDVGKLRPTLFDVFGEDASPKCKTMETHVDNKQEVYAGATNQRVFPDSGILISGCQTDQTSADATPGGFCSCSVFIKDSAFDGSALHFVNNFGYSLRSYLCRVHTILFVE
ncbi:hypothetical protein Leryth_001844 [Lithospermum erythrorhizon]|nr:hypothetical protein Leryth_001844 [Lithospermum erythrorhizon]